MAKQQQQNGSARRSVSDLLKEQVQHLTAEISSVEERLQPLHDEVGEIQVEIDELRKRQDEIAAQRREIEQNELVPLRNELSQAARATGGRALSDSPGE